MVCIVHHWDADGICSAAILAEVLEGEGKDWRNVTPEIGKFEFPEDRIHGPELHVVDLNLPERIEAIASGFDRILFLDHHLQKRIKHPNVVHVNPNLEQKNFPSASWVASDYFHRWNHLSALGAIGDVGEGVLRGDLGKKMSDLLGELGKNKAVKLVRLIDSNYIVMDRRGVEKAVTILLKNSPSQLLELRKWNENLEKVSKEVERIISLCEGGNPCEVFFRSNMNVISMVAKKIAWEQKKDVLAVNENFNGKAQIFLRTYSKDSIDISGIITKLKSKGFNAGGKKDVLGVICGRRDVERVLEIIKSLSFEVKK